MTGVLGLVVIVGGSLLLTLLAVVLVRRLIPHQIMARHNDVAGFVYATTGVTYAVVLAFVVIAVWENYATTREIADHEASAVGALYRLGQRLPRAAPGGGAGGAARLRRGRGRGGVAGDGGRGGPDPGDVGGAGPPVRVYQQPDFVAAVNAQQYGEALDQLDEVSVTRRERVLASYSGLPDILWLVLIGGGVLVVAFAFLFGVESAYSQAAIMSGLTLTISLLLFVVADAQHPFRGGFAVHPEGMESVLAQFGHPTGPSGTPAATPTP